MFVNYFSVAAKNTVEGVLFRPSPPVGFGVSALANKTLTRREGNSILKASFNRRKITAVEDDIICTEKIIAERKTFFLDLKQNARGKVVRITEKVSSNRDRIMVPAEILDDFIAALQDIRETLKQQGE